MGTSTIDSAYLDLFGGFHHRVYCSRFGGSASFTAIRIQGLMGKKGPQDSFYRVEFPKYCREINWENRDCVNTGQEVFPVRPLQLTLIEIHFSKYYSYYYFGITPKTSFIKSYPCKSDNPIEVSTEL